MSPLLVAWYICLCSTAKGIALHSHAVIVHSCPFEDSMAGAVVNNLASSQTTNHRCIDVSVFKSQLHCFQIHSSWVCATILLHCSGTTNYDASRRHKGYNHCSTQCFFGVGLTWREWEIIQWGWRFYLNLVCILLLLIFAAGTWDLPPHVVIMSTKELCAVEQTLGICQYQLSTI